MDKQIEYMNISNNKLKDKTFLYDYRRKMVEYHLDGHSYRETAKVFGVNKKKVVGVVS